MGWLDALLRRRDDTATALWAAIVRRARAPHWYVAGRVPDTIDGRFDTVAAVLAFVLLRLEQEAEAVAFAARLTERFVEDMEGQVRQIGIGDIVVGKHVGRMMGMLGGRLGAYRDGLAAGNLAPALLRNLYRGADPGAAAVAHVAGALLAWRDALAATPLAALAAGEVA